MSGDFDFEPVRGIPGPLQDGERLLWQGAPCWRQVAVHVFHVRAVAIYFAACLAWRFGASLHDHRGVGDALASCLPLFALAAAALAFLTLIAWLTGRTTVYSITDRRVFMRFGVALPITLYLPFRAIGAAALKLYSDGTGSIPLSLSGTNRFAYLLLWPHARPWKLFKAEPTLRFVPDARGVADILGRAVAAAQTGSAPVVLASIAHPAEAHTGKTVSTKDSPPQSWPSAPAAA